MSDFHAAIASGVAQAITSICRDLTLASANLAKSQLNKLVAEFEIGFTKYTHRTFEKCSKVKTLLHRHEPISINSAYVAPYIGFSKRSVDEDEFIKLLDEDRKVVVTGIAGSGKSMFLKHLFVSMCNSSQRRIPIFIELRNLASSQAASLLDYIHSQVSSVVTHFTSEQLHYCLKNGKFVLLLDAIDEIDYSVRDKYCSEILDIAFKFPETRIVITSRPSDRFISWNEFHTGHILPLEKHQAIELIEKIDYDETVKNNFLQQIDETLFQTHEEFISNPLLCTMMLMTFDEFAEIPSKIHVFYEQAFNVLYNKHDATKASFRRKFYTSLSVDELKRILATFSFFSYLDRKISFTDEAARDYIRKAASYESIKVDDQLCLNDLQESLCLLLRDGDVLTFLHRSFQEYFVAVFVSQSKSTYMKEAIKEIVGRHFFDTVVLPMLIDMSRETFETIYFRNDLDGFCKKIQSIDAKKQPLKLFKLFYTSVHVDLRDEEEDPLAFAVTARLPMQTTLSILRQFYQDDYKFKWPHPNQPLEKVLISHGFDTSSGDVSIEENELTDQILIDLGISEYFHTVKVGAPLILDKIDQRARQRTNLISVMLSKKEVENESKAKR